MNTDSRPLQNAADGPQDPVALFADYKKYLAEIGERTRTPVGSPLTEDQFNTMWNKLSFEERRRLAAAFAQGFVKSAMESWPRTKAVLDAIEAGHRDPQIVHELEYLFAKKTS